MMATREQIEARALELHQTRKANQARRYPALADLMTYDGGERDFCLREAASQLEIEGDEVEKQTAEDKWYADQFATMSDKTIEAGIRRIDEEVEMLPYYSLRVNIAEREKALKADRSRMVKEQFRRSVAASDLVTTPRRAEFFGAALDAMKVA